MNSLKPRLLTAAVGIPAALVFMLLTELWHPLAAIIVGIINAVMIMEYLSARRLTSCIPLTAVCAAFALLVPMLILTPYWYLAATLLIIASAVVLIKLHKKLNLAAFTYAFSGTVLITFGMCAFPIVVDNSVSPSFFFVMLLLLPWMADGGGYFIGSSLGKHKLCPDISPKKTVEGVIGGFVFCLISALVMGLVFQLVVFREHKVNFFVLVLTALLVSASSVLGDELFHRVCRTINGYDTLGEFYGDARASLDVVKDMVQEGCLSQMEMAAMMDGDRLSDAGQEVIENLLIGKAFEANPDAVRMTTGIRSMRKVVITALTEVVNSICLGSDYTLEKELARAIQLVYMARRNGGQHEGDKVSGFARQMTLFGDAQTVADYTDGAMLLLSDLLNDKRCTRLKRVLAVYNHNAKASANGQTDMFLGRVKTKDEILEDVYAMLGCEAELKELMGVATRARVAAAKETKKAETKREKSGACSGYAEREQARPQVKAETIDLTERLRQALLAKLAA